MTLDRDAAREFSESFGMIGAGWWRQVAWAQQQRIPEALGLTTREWVQQYVGGWARLAIEDRREAVRELTTSEDDGGMGLSQRQAADVLGVGLGTVQRDLTDPDGSLESIPEHEPDPIGSDEPKPTPVQDEPDHGEADSLVAYVGGLTHLRGLAPPAVVARRLNRPNQGLFVKRMRAAAKYLTAVADAAERSNA